MADVSRVTDSTDAPREMYASEVVECLHAMLQEVRDQLGVLDGKAEQIAADRRYWQGRKDSIVEAIGTIERGVSDDR
jgi:hypothetical protein